MLAAARQAVPFNRNEFFRKLYGVMGVGRAVPWPSLLGTGLSEGRPAVHEDFPALQPVPGEPGTGLWIRSRSAHLRLITETLIGDPFSNSAEFPT